MTSTLQRIVPLGGLLILLVAFAWVGMSLSSFGSRPPAIEDAAATLTVGSQAPSLPSESAEATTSTEAAPEPAPSPEAPAPAPVYTAPAAPAPVYTPPAPVYTAPAAPVVPEVIVPQAPLDVQDLDDDFDDFGDDGDD